MDKLPECAVAAQLKEHLTSNDQFVEFHSGFRTKDSNESTLVRVTNDLLVASDRGLLNIFVLLDSTAAFDTVFHDILWTQLKEKKGHSGIVLF